MPPESPTLFVAHFPDRQTDCVRAPQRILSRDEQVSSAAEALRVAVSGRLHIRDAECEMQSFYGSPFKYTRGQEIGKVECLRFLLQRVDSRGFECRLQRSGSTTAGWLEGIPSPSVASLMPRLHGVLEHVVGHAAALCDALGLVENPVDAQIDAALPVLFLRLRE
jgi:hypothetical protein